MKAYFNSAFIKFMALIKIAYSSKLIKNIVISKEDESVKFQLKKWKMQDKSW